MERGDLDTFALPGGVLASVVLMLIARYSAEQPDTRCNFVHGVARWCRCGSMMLEMEMMRVERVREHSCSVSGLFDGICYGVVPCGNCAPKLFTMFARSCPWTCALQRRSGPEHAF